MPLNLPASVTDFLAKQEAADRTPLNIYTCRDCGGHIVTKDIDVGVTPFMLMCRATEGCKGMMQSSMYRVFDQAMRPSHEWYRPQSLDGLSDEEVDHVMNGGLLIREATHAA